MKTNMKKLVQLSFLLLILVLTSCKKDPNDVVIPNTPKTEVPSEMLTPANKYWTLGTVSSVNFYDTNSGYYNYVKNGGGVVVFLKFKEGGYFEGLVYVVVNSYGTETETWTSYEGTVEFMTEKGQNVLKTHAQKGKYRIRKNGQETSRSIPAEDLSNQLSTSFLWEKWINPNNPTKPHVLLVNLDFYPEVKLDDIAGTVKQEMVQTFRVED
jgi:hypothetical protein